MNTQIIYEIKLPDHRYGKTLVYSNGSFRYYKFVAGIPLLRNTRILKV